MPKITEATSERIFMEMFVSMPFSEQAGVIKALQILHAGAKAKGAQPSLPLAEVAE